MKLDSDEIQRQQLIEQLVDIGAVVSADRGVRFGLSIRLVGDFEDGLVQTA